METGSVPSGRRELVRWWGWLLLATIAFQLLIALRYFGAADLQAPAAVWAFRAAMLLAHFTTLSALLLSPVLLLILLYPRRIAAIAVGSFLSTLILCALLIDTQVYQLYRFHINAGVLNLLFGGAASETFIFPAVMYIEAAMIAAAVALAVVGAALLGWRFVARSPGRPRRAKAIAAVLTISILGFHLTHIWADALAHESIVEQTDVLPLRYAATAKRALRSFGVNVRSKPLLASGMSSQRNVLAYPLQPLQCDGPSQPPNIIVILIDSWRFDALNERVTPNLAAFAQRSVRFTDHYSGGNATRIGVFSLFYSVPGTYWHQMLAERQGPVFIDQLLKQGYDVQVFRSTPLYSPEFDRTVFAQLRDVRIRSDGKGPADWDRDLSGDFLSFLDSRQASNQPSSQGEDRPFFSLLFYDSPHTQQVPADYPAPFQPSVKHVNYLRLNETTPVEPVLNRYLNSVHYVDSLVGDVLARIEAQGLLENSVIVVTGDHGQEFNDNGLNYWGHGSNYTRYQTGVPFLLYAPGLEPRTYGHTTTHFDVMPTLMRKHLGCRTAFRTHSVGRPLFEPGGREPLLMSEYGNFAIVQPDRIAVVHQHRLDMRDENYVELHGVSMEPEIIQEALEQRTRFLKPLRLNAK